MKVSVVVPVFNESTSVRTAHLAIAQVFASQLPGTDLEIIFVDDGSCDDSFAHLSALAAEFWNVRVIKLTQNCGSHMAIRAGLEHATGEAACFMACDLQDPPGLIAKMLGELKGPVQLVWAVRDVRRDPWTSRLSSRLFFFLARRIVSRNLAPHGASMCLLGTMALRSARLHRERNLTLDGLLATMAFPQARVSYERRAREHGSSRWTLGKRLKLFADFFVGYSYTPIRFMSYLGIATAVIGFLYGAIVFMNRILFSRPIQGWTSLMMVFLIMGGIQMVMLGIIGEYLWRTLDEARARPRYVIEEFLNPSYSEVEDEQVTRMGS